MGERGTGMSGEYSVVGSEEIVFHEWWSSRASEMRRQSNGDSSEHPLTSVTSTTYRTADTSNPHGCDGSSRSYPTLARSARTCW